MDSLKEWALEGESKTVDKTERKLRYQIEHMTVCDERIREVSSRVAPQENDSCPSIGLGQVFLWEKSWKRHIPIRTVITYSKRHNKLRSSVLAKVIQVSFCGSAKVISNVADYSSNRTDADEMESTRESASGAEWRSK